MQRPTNWATPRNFLILFLQVVKHVVKEIFCGFIGKRKQRKSQCLQGLSAVLNFSNEYGMARSQSKRATNCATPRLLNWKLEIENLQRVARFLLQLSFRRRSRTRSPSASCCHSLLLALSTAGGARKRPQLRHTLIVFNYLFAIVLSLLIDQRTTHHIIPKQFVFVK